VSIAVGLDDDPPIEYLVGPIFGFTYIDHHGLGAIQITVINDLNPELFVLLTVYVADAAPIPSSSHCSKGANVQSNINFDPLFPSVQVSLDGQVEYEAQWSSLTAGSDAVPLPTNWITSNTFQDYKDRGIVNRVNYRGDFDEGTGSMEVDYFVISELEVKVTLMLDLQDASRFASGFEASFGVTTRRSIVAFTNFSSGSNTHLLFDLSGGGNKQLEVEISLICEVDGRNATPIVDFQVEITNNLQSISFSIQFPPFNSTFFYDPTVSMATSISLSDGGGGGGLSFGDGGSSKTTLLWLISLVGVLFIVIIGVGIILLVYIREQHQKKKLRNAFANINFSLDDIHNSPEYVEDDSKSAGDGAEEEDTYDSSADSAEINF